MKDQDVFRRWWSGDRQPFHFNFPSETKIWELQKFERHNLLQIMLRVRVWKRKRRLNCPRRIEHFTEPGNLK
jgi:hypothetical protein